MVLKSVTEYAVCGVCVPLLTVFFQSRAVLHAKSS